MNLKNNIKNAALIFEGGGMRASYTAGILNTLLENGIYFDYVAGISAGSSHTVNYISRDMERAKKSFVDFVKDPNFGGWKSFIKGEGLFRAKYIYEEACLEDAFLPFDFETFQKNPADLRIGAFNRKTGRQKYFTKDDIKNISDLMKIVRCSSSMPFFMPPTYFKDEYYVDGGIAGGIPLDIAIEDGYDKFFVVLTREEGYRKEPKKNMKFMKILYRKYPYLLKAMEKRHIVYNETMERLRALEKEGKAYLVYPKIMPVDYKETDYEKLERSYKLGYNQGKKEVDNWKEFLF
ncbi:MAG: patatin family protein [Bacillota bacterium]|nr:patatin family protein [Bacillota bacterium]